MNLYKREVSNSEDILDSRDIIARFDELQTDILIAFEEKNSEDAELDWEKIDPFEWLDGDEADEYNNLKSLIEEASAYAGDWKDGATLVRDTYFEDYAEELADDIGAIDSNASWPLNHINWKAAANDLKMDYTEVDFDGVAYWVRN